ncbi:hypothetical protein [Bacillus cereus]|uniref:hypothetical protein n=2 Tax=Bacillus TaxID=1386 RepID=UPI0009B40BCD
MVNNKLIVEVSADTTEVLEGIKEVTAAANECVKSFEKLGKVMERFEMKPVQMLRFSPVTKITTNPNEIARTVCKGTQI